MRKPKAILETQLTDEQQLDVMEWLCSPGPLADYRICSQQIKKEFGVTAGKDAVATFYHKVCVPFLIDRKRRAREASEQITPNPEHDQKIVNSMLSELKQRAFEVLIKPNADPKEIVLVLSQALKARDQDQVDRKLAQKDKELAQNKDRHDLVVRKYEDQLAKVRDIAAAAKSKGGLTPETLEQIEQAAKLL